MTHFDLSSIADHDTVQQNPHKGWYHHWYDNGIKQYPPDRDEELAACPGLGLIYLRVPWCELEPSEGDFRWELLDDIIDRWTPRLVRFALRITCRETSYDFATPEWVVKAGARGGRVEREEWGRKPWQPDWGCPIFLDKLERFHRAAAAHWLHHPGLDHVDLGSYGTWGEGHTWPAQTPNPTVDVMRQHLDLHCRCWPGTQLVVTDEWLGWDRSEPEMEALTEMTLAAGATLRDDSFLVDYYVKQYRDKACIMRPQLFERFWRTKPTILEHDHYGAVVKAGNWRGGDGREFGAHLVRRALEITHATWTGWHGSAKDWLRDNPQLTAEIANRVGYWYFLESVRIISPGVAGGELRLDLRWRNRGVAPAYQLYRVQLRLRSTDGERILETAGSDNRLWMPDTNDEVAQESVTAAIPGGISPGDYELSLRMTTLDCASVRPIRLGMHHSRRDSDGWYRIGRFVLPPG